MPFATDNDTFNPAGASFWSENLAGQPNLLLDLEWNSTFTVAFEDALGNPIQVENPILHFDKIGGGTGSAGSEVGNSGLYTLQGGLTWTELTGTADMLTTSTTAVDSSFNQPGHNLDTESSADESTGTASGSMRVNGTVSQFSVVVTQAGPNGFGKDTIEIGVRAAPEP